MPIFRFTALIAVLAYTAPLVTAAADHDTVTDSAQQIDRSIKPGDDFYRYANGGWLKTAKVSDQMPSYDNRAILVARTSQRVRDLIQAAAIAQSTKGSVTQKVGDYYASFMDESAIEAKGMAPLADEMVQISRITSKAMLSAYLGGTLNSEVDGLTSNSDHIFGVWVNQSFTDSKHYVFHLMQGGLGLPDREAYLDPSEKAAALRRQYQSHIASMLRFAGVADSESKAAQILALEIRIAQSHAPDSDAADTFKQNNPWKAAGLEWTTQSPPTTFNFDETPQVTWEAYNYDEIPAPEEAFGD